MNMVGKVCLLALALFCAASAFPEGGNLEVRDSRITGGVPISIQEFPYVAALVYYYPRPQIYIQRCVGTIVSSYHVLASAYCFTGADLSNMYARAGSSNSLAGGMVVTIQDVVIHPEYQAEPRTNDLAVVFVSSPLPIGPNINTLLLPPQGYVIPEYQTFKIVSWGFEREGGHQWQNLMYIFLDKVNTVVCNSRFAGVYDLVIDDNVVCAARPDEDGPVGTCFGDSGAPLTVNNVVFGIASAYHECGTDNYPDVFTRVDRYTNWIMEVAQRWPRDDGVPVRVASV